MIRKISAIIIMVVIIITGTFAFVNLRYWERSVRIFRMNSDQSSFRDSGRGRGGLEERRRETGTNGFNRDADFGERQFPDSLRRSSGDRRDLRALPDSLRQKFRSGEFRGDRENFRGTRDFGRRGGDSHGGNRVSLGEVAGFFAVFSLFALVTLAVDKGLQWFRFRKKYNNT